MFYELRYVDDILEGPLWFDPDTSEVINILDMEESHGPAAEGLWIAQIGKIHINEERIGKAAKSFGMFNVEEGMRPHSRRKSWDPRPTPKANQPRGYRILEAYRKWKEADSLEDLPAATQADFLIGAELVFAQYGFSGGPWESVGVVREGSDPKFAPKNSTVTREPAQVLRYLFEKWAIKGSQASEGVTLSGSGCSPELREFGERFHAFIWDREAVGLISGYCVTGGDWLTGACGILADAVVRWLGRDAQKVTVTAEVEGGRLPVHVAVRTDGCYLDAEGVSTEEELLKRWRGRVLDPKVGKFKADPGIISDPRTARKLARLLEAKLGPSQK